MVTADPADVTATTDFTKPIDIAATSIGTIDTDIAATSVGTIDTDIAATSVGNIGVDIASQSVNNLGIDIEAQTLSQLGIDIQAQQIGVATATQFEAEAGNIFTSSASGSVVSGGSFRFETHDNNTGAAQVMEIGTFIVNDTSSFDLVAEHRVRNSNGNVEFSVAQQAGDSNIYLDPGLQIQDGWEVDTIVENYESSDKDVSVGVIGRGT